MQLRRDARRSFLVEKIEGKTDVRVLCWRFFAPIDNVGLSNRYYTVSACFLVFFVIKFRSYFLIKKSINKNFLTVFIKG